MALKLDKILRIGVFITSHGFGHATRTCAVLNEITQSSNCSIDIFSTLPSWFLKQNILCKNFEAHYLKTDVGLVQKSPFVHDLQETINQLKDFLLFRSVDSQKAITISRKKKFNLIISDISPLGIKVADQLGIQSVLIENFTWDWIYCHYRESHKEFDKIIESLRAIFERSGLHIQARPFCLEKNSSLKTSPISRRVNKSKEEIRDALNIEKNSKIILLTTGGITKKLSFIERLHAVDHCTFIISGDFKNIVKDHNIISLPMNSAFHYPDLVSASSCVVGKVGYGTLAECWSSKTPLLGCYRNDFGESEVLRDFANKNLKHKEISIDDFERMNWAAYSLFSLLEDNPSPNVPPCNGAIEAAEYILSFIERN